MSKRKTSATVKDILRCADNFQTYTAHLSFHEFSKNFMVVEACLYNIQIIGEAASKLSWESKQNTPNVPWALIKGMPDRLIHEYFGTDLEKLLRDLEQQGL